MAIVGPFGKCYRLRIMSIWKVGLPAHKVLEVSNMAFFLDLQNITVLGILWVLNTYLMDE